MQFLDAATIRKRLDWPAMIGALEAALQADIHVPVRVNHRIDVPGLPSGSLLLMPAIGCVLLVRQQTGPDPNAFWQIFSQVLTLSFMLLGIYLMVCGAFGSKHS